MDLNWIILWFSAFGGWPKIKFFWTWGTLMMMKSQPLLILLNGEVRIGHSHMEPLGPLVVMVQFDWVPHGDCLSHQWWLQVGGKGHCTYSSTPPRRTSSILISWEFLISLISRVCLLCNSWVMLFNLSWNKFWVCSITAPCWFSSSWIILAIWLQWIASVWLRNWFNWVLCASWVALNTSSHWLPIWCITECTTAACSCGGTPTWTWFSWTNLASTLLASDWMMIGRYSKNW